MKLSKPKNVLISLWMEGSPGRKHLAGVLRYVNAHTDWNIKFLSDPEALTPEMVRSATNIGIDGFLVYPTPLTAAALAESPIPLVTMDFPPPRLLKRKKSAIFVFNDDEDIGARGADHLLSLGNYATYAFIPDSKQRGWSRLRERGFKNRLNALGHSCFVYDHRKCSLDQWLARLQRPIAIMTAYDYRALDVLESCSKINLNIPNDVAVLGVDNDEIVCDHTSPTISSVKVDHEGHGFLCAQLLDQLMSERKQRPARKSFYRAEEIVERESTRPIAPAVEIVRKINRYISEQAAEGISVADIVSNLGVSRRLADLRFKQLTGQSIRRTIENRRLELATERLANTKLPIKTISRLAGYENIQRLKYVFKRRFGMTMREWRQTHASRKLILKPDVHQRPPNR